MTQSNPLHSEETSELNARMLRDATYAAVLLTAAGLAFFAFAISVVNFQDWQDYILVGLPLVLAGASLASIFFMRRGRLALGSGILFSLNLLLPLVLTIIVSGTLWTALAYAAISSALLIWRTLPRSSWRWAIIVLSVVLGVIVAINMINPPGRFDAPAGFNVFITVLLAIMFTAFVVQAVRQAWSGNIRAKIITSFTLVAFVSLGILGTVTYFNYRNQVREDIRQRLLNIASITATQMDGDLHATLQTPKDMQTEAYRQMMAQGDEIVATDPTLTYAYTMRLNDQGQIYFIIDSRQADDTERVDLGTVYEEPSETLLAYMKTPDRPFVEKEIVTDEYGSFLSAYAPFYRADGSLEGIVGVDIAADKVLAQEQEVLNLILGTTLATLFIVTLLGLWLGGLFVGPIVNLSRATHQIIEGDLSARAEIETTDEVGDLANDFNTMTSQLQGTLQGLEKRVAERTRNLELAAEVGRSVSQVRDLDVMLKDACELILKEFDLYYVQVYLTDPSQTTLKLEAGTGDVGSQLIGRSHSLPFNTGSINGRAAVERRSVVISDTTKSATFRQNPLLPDTRGEMSVPLIVADKVVGVLDMQSRETGVLSEEILPAFEALAGQMAVAIQNANLLAEAEQARTEVENQARRLVRQGWNEHLDAIHKPAQIGYVFDHNTVTSLSDVDESHLPEAGNTISASIALTGESLGSLEVEIGDETKREQTNELVNVVARQIAQQIENLRLLESAERYRSEAEEASRRLTREGWNAYMANANEKLGYFYDLNEVRPYDGNGQGKPAMSVPLKVRDEVLGKLSIQGLDATDSESIALASVVAERLGAHIESLRQLEETQRGQFELDRRAQQLAAVAEISTASSRELDIQKMLESVASLTQRKFGLYHAHIFTYDENTEELKINACGWKEGDKHDGTHEMAAISITKEQSLVARAARTRKAVIVNNVFVEPGWLPNPMLPDTVSELAVPLVIGDQILGVLDVQSDRINAFTEEDANIQTTLASQVATALQNARSFARAQQQAERESTLNVISQKIQSATSVEAVLQIAARELGHALGAPMTIAQLSMKEKS